MENSTKVLATAFAAALTSTAAYADCGEISITEMDWASSAVVTHVADFLMTNGYGCTVKRVPSSTTPAMTSMAETGEPDILTELWVNSSPIYSELRDSGKLVELADVLSDGGVEAWWIPAYLAEKHPELRTIEGILANPDLVGGQFHDCPSGWACDVVDNNVLKALDAKAKGLERFQHGSGETLATAIAAAYQDKAPWFGYYWAPTSVLGKYPMVQVDLGPFDQEIHSCNGNPDCPTPGVSPFPVAKVVTAVTPNLPKREPEVTAFLSKMSFSNEQMGAVLAWQDDNNASYEEAAAYFLSTYKDTWASWLDDAARGKLSALLD
ncbi:ABC transporter substrate-binding protein [Leisingera sp. ANG59]|uniref:ABC transporter substrate-binding protein n=1 Tax=Leisingera sp. ANG59 TaxID=2675221 RepID=UPI001572462D|nr:ABC transporter substrate-binding protein [Leisingera sp. ANG59]NSY40906.1 glycine/betaine ABC transporter substrate-binding protein [Leisingera sp. ANG59]